MRETPFHRFTGPIRPVPVGAPCPSISTVFGLAGAQIARETELDAGWLLTDALRRHRAMLSDRDAPVISAAISGLTDSFCEGDTVALSLSRAPGPGNGFTSLSTLRSHAAPAVLIEVCTGHPGPHRLAPAAPDNAGRGPNASALTRAVEAPAPSEPERSVKVSLRAARHLAPGGSICLAALCRLIDPVEAEASATHPVITARRIVLSAPRAEPSALRATLRVSQRAAATETVTRLCLPDGRDVATIVTTRAAATF